MIRTLTLAAIAVTGLSGAAHAADCIAANTDPWELTDAEVNTLYACMSDKMVEGYTKGDNPVAAVYRDWAATATRPALEGSHQERYLMTFANDLAAPEYLKFAEEGVEIPVGGILAKESFKVRAEGVTAVGPLFIMEKVGLDQAPDTMGWLYSGVLPNGKPLNFQQAFCHDCHVNWESQDALAYPLEEVRISAN